MAPTRELQETLYQELLGRIQETDLTVPELESGWLYYIRTEAGMQYPILCRRRDVDGAPEEVLLDQNERGAGLGYYRAAGLDGESRPASPRLGRGHLRLRGVRGRT